MKPTLRFVVAACLALAALSTHAGNLQVDLAPAAAVSAGAKWRVDGGSWRNDNATVKNLANSTHTVDFKAVSGWLAPSPVAVTITSGTTTLAATYVRPAALRVTLTPGVGQWRIDGGAWRSCGATVTNLTPANHAIEYSALPGYAAPPAEVITLIANQTTSLERNYTQLAAVTMTLAPGSAQWRIDGGAWRDGGTTAGDLLPGSHSIDYAPVSGYVAPASETVDLAAGQALSLTRSYVQLAELTVTLSPAAAQWQLDGGAWNDSGVTLSNLTVGSHSLEFAPLPGHTTPSGLQVMLQPGANATSATYQPILPTLTVVLYPANAQYRIDGSGPHPSGSTTVFSAPGTYVVEFEPVAGHPTPDPMPVTLAWGDEEELTVYYSPPPPQQVTIDVTPSSGLWRIDGGAWQSSGATVSDLAVGEHQLEFSTVAGYIPPPPASVTLALGEQRTIGVSHSLGAATLTVTLDPAHARWRLDGGAWNASSASLPTTSGPHAIEYEPVAGHDTPATENLLLQVDENRSLERAYEPAAYAVVSSFQDAGTNGVVVFGSDGMVYVATRGQGSNGVGQIARMNLDGTNYQILKSFLPAPDQPAGPNALIEGSDGVLYGTFLAGGANGHGALFRLAKDGSGYAVLRNFGSGSDSGPVGLTEFSDGNLYGTTTGTSGSSRSMFRIAKDGTGYFVFSDSRGAKSLTEGPDGWIYATTDSTTFGGTFGTAFRVRPNGIDMTVLKNFNTSAEAATPRSAPLYGSDGLLYGTTSAGGTVNKGVIYRMNPDGSGFTVLRSFLGNASDGGRLDAPLTEGPDGLLYGATFNAGAFGRGTVFRIQKDGTGYVILRHFESADGAGLGHRLLIASDGTIVSANGSLGGDLAGLVFRINSDGTGFGVVSHFGAPGGAMPVSAIEGADGALYGLTYNGGGARNGGIFRVNKDGTGMTLLRGFAASNDGRQPMGHLARGSDGFLYGTTVSGGPVAGTVFRILPDGSGYAIVHAFGTVAGDGYLPLSGVIEASDGRLYGSTGAGGTSGGYGALYRVERDGSGHTILRSYGNASPEGHSPVSPLLEGADGRLYGTTSGGGTANAGTVFVMAKDGTGYTILHHFGATANDGVAPYAALIQRADGRLYGTTNAGGDHGSGTVFALNPDGTDYAVLKSFAGGSTEGANPYYAALTEKNGVLHGTTVNGGSFAAGTAFRLNPDGNGFATLLNFGLDAADGRLPRSGLHLGSDGVFYGTTDYGAGGGIVFRLRID